MGSLYPLSVCCHISRASNWALNKVKEIHHFFKMNCEGYEEQIMVLLTTIEVGHITSMKSCPKKHRELKRLILSTIMRMVQIVQDPKGRG